MGNSCLDKGNTGYILFTLMFVEIVLNRAYFAVNVGFHTFGITVLYNSDHVFVQSLEDSGRLWRSVLHGYTRRRNLPGGQRLSERSLGEFTYDTNKEHVWVFFRFYSPVWFFRAWHTG